MADPRLVAAVVAALALLAAILLYSSTAAHAPSTATGTGGSAESASTGEQTGGGVVTESCGGGVCLPPNTSTATAPEGLGNVSEGFYIVEIGDPGCPHCRAMEKFFAEKLSGVESYFCSIARKECGSAFWLLYNKHLTVGVPAIVVCDNLTQRVVFIEVGEYRNATWWVEKLSSPPSEPLVYKVGEPWKKLTVEEAKELYTRLCVDTLRAAQPIG